MIGTTMLSVLLIGCGPKKSPEVVTEKAPVPVSQQPIPVVGEAPDFRPLTPKAYDLGNRSKLWVHEAHELPLVVLKAVLPGGYFHDPSDRSGQAWLVSQLMDESAGGKSALNISEALRLTASRLSVSVGRTETTVTLSVLKAHLDEMLPYFVNAVLRPDFTVPILLKHLRLPHQVLLQLT